MTEQLTRVPRAKRCKCFANKRDF